MARGSCLYAYEETDQEEQELAWFCQKHKRYETSPFSIDVPTQAIENVGLVACKGVFPRAHQPFGTKESDFFVASDRWGELAGQESINLLNAKCLKRLMPTSGGVHLVTFQNGIQNSPNDFIKSGNSVYNHVLNHFPEAPICIGFYNPTTENLIVDTFRALSRYAHKNCGFIQRVALFFESLLAIGTSLIPHFRWVHVSHSEGGAIAHLAFRMVMVRHQAWMRHHITRHLISASYGPLLPIPKSFALMTYNSYSENDNVTLRFSKSYEGHPNYNIEILKDEFDSSPSFRLPQGDHDFLGRTYQRALNKNLEDISDKIQKGEI